MNRNACINPYTDLHKVSCATGKGEKTYRYKRTHQYEGIGTLVYANKLKVLQFLLKHTQ